MIYIRLSCRKSKGDESNDLRDLLAGADGVAGMAADLPVAEPAEQHRREEGGGQHKCNGDKRQGVQREKQEDQQTRHQRDVAFAFARLAGICGNAGGLGGGQGLPVPHHQGAAEDERGDQAGGGGFSGKSLKQGCECCGTQRKGKNHGDGAIAADAAVLHDLERAGPVLAAAETVGHVGQPVLMQCACHERRQADGEPARELRRCIETGENHHQESGGQGDQQTGSGKGAGGAAHRHAVGIVEKPRRNRQAAEKGEGMHDICYKIPGLHALSVAVAAFPVVPRRFRDYERRNKDRFAGKHKFPDI